MTKSLYPAGRYRERFTPPSTKVISIESLSLYRTPQYIVGLPVGLHNLTYRAWIRQRRFSQFRHFFCLTSVNRSISSAGQTRKLRDLNILGSKVHKTLYMVKLWQRCRFRMQDKHGSKKYAPEENPGRVVVFEGPCSGSGFLTTQGHKTKRAKKQNATGWKWNR